MPTSADQRTTAGDQIGQLAYDPPVRDTRIDHRRWALARHIIDDVEHTEPTTGGELIVDEGS